MGKLKELFNTSRKAAVSAVCVAEILLIPSGITACTANNGNAVEYITMEKAEEIVLSDAGMTASDVTSMKTKQDMNDGISVYDIEFYAKDVKYEYEVKMDTGSIYSKSKEILADQENVPDETKQDISLAEGLQTDGSVPDETQPNTVQASPQQNTTKQPDPPQQDTTTQTVKPQQDTTAQAGEPQQNTAQLNTKQPAQSGKEQISLEEAKNVALADAGVSSSEVTYTKEKLDYEDGIAVYDIEFYTGTMEYEYEINAATGAVYSKDVETHHTEAGHGQNTQTSGTYIGDDNAKSIALNHAGFAAADVNRLKSEFDIDDGQAVYEVEFYKDGREYDYKINASDGTIMKYEVD